MKAHIIEEALEQRPDFTACEGGAPPRARGAPPATSRKSLRPPLVERTGVRAQLMVQRTVPGRPLCEVVTRLSGPHRYDVLAEVGELVARCNGIYVDGECDWPPTSMAADLAYRCAERNQILAGGFSASEFDRMLDLIEGYVRDFPCERWVLCHGDLSPKHIFVTGDGSDGLAVRVTGFIDFGDWRPGAPVHDLAVLRIHGPELGDRRGALRWH